MTKDGAVHLERTPRKRSDVLFELHSPREKHEILMLELGGFVVFQVLIVVHHVAVFNNFQVFDADATKVVLELARAIDY